MRYPNKVDPEVIKDTVGNVKPGLTSMLMVEPEKNPLNTLAVTEFPIADSPDL
jgi:hypothetical protein